MKNLIKTLVSTALIIVFAMNCCIFVFAKENTSLSKETIEKMMQKDFADDSVIVVFEQKPSIEYQTITIDMFKEIDGERIFRLSSAVESKLRTAISNGMSQIRAGENPTIDTNLDFSDFNSIVSIKLAKPGKENVIKAINALRARDDVKYAGPNFVIRQDDLFEDNAEESGVTYTSTSTINDLLDLESAWATAEFTYDNSFRVAIIDSGVDVSHPLLKLSTQSEELWADFSRLEDFNEVTEGRKNSDGEIIHFDETGHGTHVAGIISSTIDENFWDVNNINKHINIISVKIFDVDGAAHTSELIAAINYVEECNIKLINFSGGENFDPYEDELVTDLYEAIENYQGLFVCAAGNNSANVETSTVYPAKLSLNNIITVGASNAYDQICSFSNFGNVSVDLFAPGQAIYSTYSLFVCDEVNCKKPGSHISYGYHSASGTSMAAPYVTGVAAMLWCIDGSLTRERVRSFIIDPDNTDYSTNFYNKCVTEGRLNAYKVVLAATTPCTHSNASYTYNANTHTLICPDCSYMLTEAHNNSYTYTAYTHSLKCSDCSYSTGYGLHDGSYITYNENTHTYSCSVCPYILTSAHELFVYSDNGEYGVTIKCSQCNYMRTCYNGVAEYGYANTRQHYVSCTCGCYNFLSQHVPLTIASTGDLYTHQEFCRDCGVHYPAEHSWVAKDYGAIQGYECLMCKMFSISIPGVMQIPSDGEISISSCDDHGTGVALLPEREDDFVTE